MDYTKQSDLQKPLMERFFGPITPLDVNYANDVTYGSLIGRPFFDTDPRDTKGHKVDYSYNYLKNVAGLNITHTAPNLNWGGGIENITKYQNFYTTVSAIQSYSAYVLSQMYADETSGKSLTTQQLQLTLQASDPSWLTKVATEEIGIVFRQILLYNSQTYVVMTQLLQAQKQMLSTLAMTNTLIVIGDSFTENQLLNKATIPGA